MKRKLIYAGLVLTILIGASAYRAYHNWQVELNDPRSDYNSIGQCP